MDYGRDTPVVRRGRRRDAGFPPGRPRRHAVAMGHHLAPGVLQIDTLLGGWERVTAGYLIEGPAPVLVETGSQSSVPALLAALADHGGAADSLAGVAVT